MSEHHVILVRLGSPERHPNADTLSVVKVHGGYPCVVRTAEWAEGDLAAYVPEDSLVDVTRPEFAFLAPKAKDGWARVRAVRLRGIFSMGLLVKPPRHPEDGSFLAGAEVLWREGDDVAEALGVRKYEPPLETASRGQDVPSPSPEPPHYDLEGLRRWMDALQPGEPVVVTEKLHGSSGRAFVFGFLYPYRVEGGVPKRRFFHVGSHTRWKDPEGTTEWAVAAREVGLQEKCSSAMAAGYAFYWECVGKVGGFPYGHQRGRLGIWVFDVCHVRNRTWLAHEDMEALCKELDLQTVPVLYRGPWDPGVVLPLAEGQSTLDPSHVREGIVVRPASDRVDLRFGRVVLKYHGEGFLTGKRG